MSTTTTYTRQDFYHPVTTCFNSEDFCGYSQKTTAWDDFSIADRFGQRAILDTYKSLLDFCGTDYVYLTELAMVLNWKLWQHYERGEKECNSYYTNLAKLYSKLWEKHCNMCRAEFKGEALDYYYRTTD